MENIVAALPWQVGVLGIAQLNFRLFVSYKP
jgi:hypothetical protein